MRSFFDRRKRLPQSPCRSDRRYNTSGQSVCVRPVVPSTPVPSHHPLCRFHAHDPKIVSMECIKKPARHAKLPCGQYVNVGFPFRPVLPFIVIIQFFIFQGSAAEQYKLPYRFILSIFLFCKCPVCYSYKITVSKTQNRLMGNCNAFSNIFKVSQKNQTPPQIIPVFHHSHLKNLTNRQTR